MSQDHGGTITGLLKSWNRGHTEALDRLMPIVHAELRRLARHHLKRERPDHSLPSAGLVNEAYLRLVDTEQEGMGWKDRAHFFGIAARIMRQILVDHARKRSAQKRGGCVTRLGLDENVGSPRGGDPELVALDDALRALEALDPRQSRIVELRFFGGLTVEETAAFLEISPATVKREWTTAKAWLYRELSRK